jgi:hypothetical protein
VGSNLVCHVDGVKVRVLRKIIGPKREDETGILEHLIVDGRIILTLTPKKQDRRESTGFLRLRK